MPSRTCLLAGLLVIASPVLAAVPPPPLPPSPPAPGEIVPARRATVRAHPLSPRPVVTSRALERTLELYRPAAAFRAAAEARLAAYEDALAPLIAEAADERRQRELGAAFRLERQLDPPPDRSDVLFPGLEPAAGEPRTVAPDDDPRWAELRGMRDRIMEREHRLWSRLRTHTMSLLADVAALAEEHEVRWSGELLTRLALESLRDGPWSGATAGGRAPVPVLAVLPPLPRPDAEDGAVAPPVWNELDRAVGREASLADLRARAWEAVLAHDAAVQEAVWADLTRLPPRTAGDGLGGRPSERQVRRTRGRAADRWHGRVEAVRRATEAMVRTAGDVDPALGAVVGEAMRLAHLAGLTHATETRPWAVRIHRWLAEHRPEAAWDPDRLDPLVLELGARADTHARALLDHVVERERRRRAEESPAGATGGPGGLAPDEGLDRIVASYEADAAALLERFAERLPTSSRTAFLEAMTATLAAQRPMPARPERRRR